ncbi:hypothetical protein [Brotaphodocola sp.]|uniref:hypothetical protein n=1 Tax=Brotaphodocola sp. TaxID=3073577 RepID=UPI003D7D647D
MRKRKTVCETGRTHFFESILLLKERFEKIKKIGENDEIKRSDYREERSKNQRSRNQKLKI